MTEAYAFGKNSSPDLDAPQHIDALVQCFYQRLLADPLVAPWFDDVAKVDLRTHLPLISLYWQKMLLGDDRYQRHTMAKHRHLHALRPLGRMQMARWLYHFEATLDASFAGPRTERARHLARRVMANLDKQLRRVPARPSGEVGNGEVGQQQPGAPDVTAGDQ